MKKIAFTANNQTATKVAVDFNLNKLTIESDTVEVTYVKDDLSLTETVTVDDGGLFTVNGEQFKLLTLNNTDEILVVAVTANIAEVRVKGTLDAVPTEPLNPTVDFIRRAMMQGQPAVVMVTLSGDISWKLGGVWLGNVTLPIHAPYASCEAEAVHQTLLDTWNYALRIFDAVEPVPFENLSDNEALVPEAIALIERVKQSIIGQPYLGRHYFSERGVNIEIEMTFKI